MKLIAANSEAHSMLIAPKCTHCSAPPRPKLPSCPTLANSAADQLTKLSITQETEDSRASSHAAEVLEHRHERSPGGVREEIATATATSGDGGDGGRNCGGDGGSGGDGIGDGTGGVGEAVADLLLGAVEGESCGGNARVVAMAIGTGLAS